MNGKSRTPQHCACTVLDARIPVLRVVRALPPSSPSLAMAAPKTFERRPGHTVPSATALRSNAWLTGSGAHARTGGHHVGRPRRRANLDP